MSICSSQGSNTVEGGDEWGDVNSGYWADDEGEENSLAAVVGLLYSHCCAALNRPSWQQVHQGVHTSPHIFATSCFFMKVMQFDV
jgi:hypothetical protein